MGFKARFTGFGFEGYDSGYRGLEVEGFLGFKVPRFLGLGFGGLGLGLEVKGLWFVV